MHLYSSYRHSINMPMMTMMMMMTAG